jgi:LEA14-like dessication related protein
MKRSAFCWGAVSALVLLLCSCVTGKLSEGVEVSLVNLGFSNATVLETTGKFVIRVQNQLPQDISLEGGVHKIYLNGIYVGSGVSNESTSIGRLSEGTQTVTVHLQNLSVARLVRDIVEQQRVVYRLDSVLYARLNGKSGQLKTSKAGTLDVKDFQPTGGF